MEEFKSGFVTLIGRTNVGKSTLLNLLVGEKVAAIANKVQTTRTAIKGIVNRENSQIIFTDTPGIHKPRTKLNETMIETSYASIADADVVLFLIEATSKDIGKGDRIILDKIKETKRKTILIINKIDLVKRENLLNLIETYSKEYNFEAVIPISSLQTKYRNIILDEIEKNLKPGPAYYDIEEYTDQTLRQLAEETIREKALNNLDEEVMVTGGAEIYKQFLPYANKLILTEISSSPKELEADAYFPTFDKKEWNRSILCSHKQEDLAYDHVVYNKK